MGFVVDSQKRHGAKARDNKVRSDVRGTKEYNSNILRYDPNRRSEKYHISESSKAHQDIDHALPGPTPFLRLPQHGPMPLPTQLPVPQELC